jgi:hypothetical protein
VEGRSGEIAEFIGVLACQLVHRSYIVVVVVWSMM